MPISKNDIPIANFQSLPEFDCMTLRDYFAAKAMQSLITIMSKESLSEHLAVNSYKFADAMLKARGE